MLKCTIVTIGFLLLSCTQNKPSLTQIQNLVNDYSITYQYPLSIGNSWKYCHYIRTKSSSGSDIVQRDSICLAVIDTTQFSGKMCYKIARTASGDHFQDTLWTLYNDDKQNGLYLYGLDSSFAGEVLLKSTAVEIPLTRLIIPRYPKKDSIWFDETSNKTIKKSIAISTKNSNQISCTVNTFIGSDTITSEIFNDSGLTCRYNFPETFGDSLSGSVITVSDSLVLVNATLKGKN